MFLVSVKLLYKIDACSLQLRFVKQVKLVLQNGVQTDGL